jgi:fatty-acyl-CoA synthase
MSDLPTFRSQVIARRDDPHTAIRFEDESYSYAEYVQCCAQRAAYLLANRQPGPLHVGILLENVPEFPIWVGAAALAGATIVGINPTRRGAELARDITHTDCQLIVTEGRYREMLAGLDITLGDDRILDIDTPAYRDTLAPYADAPIPDVEVAPTDQLLLIFTSGTSGAPKAVICSQMKLAIMGQSLIGICGLDRDTVSYQAMPLFHSNGLFTGFAPTLIAGGTAALRRKFSASGFIEDVRKFRATYFNYVGKPLSYILATPERPDDADNTLQFVFGNEAADLDIERFQKRFSVHVQDGYGSTETGASISRTDDMPEGALGVAAEGVLVLDPETEEECPRAQFDEQGRLLNAEEATGEIVNTAGGGFFEGYYKNDEANAARLRDGKFWTGDLGYRDDAGFFYFAGRDFEWLRVDGENFSAAPVERILARFEGVVLSSVYAVPDVEVGDQVMAALQVADPSAFDPAAFARFLAQQSDLGTKWAPRYVRLSRELPVTQTSKVQKRQLRAQRWECEEPVYVADRPGESYRLMTGEDVAAIRAAFEARGRGSQLA